MTSVEDFKSYVEAQGITLTSWQQEVADAYLTDRPTWVVIRRGAGQSFIHSLLRDFELGED